MVAEIGADMRRFLSAAHLSSWASMCRPGNHESAGKRRSGKTRRGNRRLRTALVEARAAARRTKHIALGARYRHLRAHVWGMDGQCSRSAAMLSRSLTT